MSTTRPATGDDGQTTCPRCFGRIEHRVTESVCAECGLVTDDAPIDHGKDWTNYESEMDKSRAAAGDPNHHDGGLGSQFGFPAERETREDKRKQRWNRQAGISKRDRNRGYVCIEIKRMGAAIEVPTSVVERACCIFRQIHADGQEGQDLDELAPAALLAACRERQLGRTAADLEPVARADEHRINRVLMRVRRDADLELPPPSVTARIRAVAGRLEGGARVADDAVALVDAVEDTALVGKAPTTLAAAALYVAGDWTQKRIGEALDVSPVSVRTHAGLFEQANTEATERRN